MWTNKNCGCYDRSKQRYPSDLMDEASNGKMDYESIRDVLPSASCH